METATAPLATFDTETAFACPSYSSSEIEPASPAALSKSLVAELTPAEITAMSETELVQAIRSVSLPFRKDDGLEFSDRPTLERLVYLARRCCRNQGY